MAAIERRTERQATLATQFHRANGIIKASENTLKMTGQRPFIHEFHDADDMPAHVVIDQQFVKGVKSIRTDRYFDLTDEGIQGDAIDILKQDV